MMGLFLMSCAIRTATPEPSEVVQTPTQTNPPLAVSSLEAELRSLYEDVDTVDGRARILLLQELIRATRFSDAEVQSAVYRHVQENIRIERRSLSMDVPEVVLDLSGIQSEELTVDFDIGGAEALMAKGDFEAASILLDVCRLEHPDCGVLWIQNQEAWAAHSIQLQVDRLQDIHGMPDGEEKREALETLLSNYEDLSLQFAETDQLGMIQNHKDDIQSMLEALP